MFDIITVCLSEALKILVEYYYISENIDLISRSLERADIIFNAEYTNMIIQNPNKIIKNNYFINTDLGFL